MNHLDFPKSFAGLLAGLLLFVLACALATVPFLGLDLASGENGPLEWTQEAMLMAAVVFSGAAALGLRGPERLAAFLATLLYAVFLLRELELPVTGPITRYLASGMFRWHETLVLAVLVLPYAALRFRFWPAILSYGLSLRGWPFALAALLVGTGAVFDGVPSLGGVAHLSTFLEETAELLGYTVLAVAAGWVLARARAEDGAAQGPVAGGAAPLGCPSRGA
ncbi:hypothetical protein D3218_12435 [Aureimonas flava]|uniref:Uncharacterized protein n=1 Tax=Aureimonas flava TaxID=2320271 RepID=A0A3A1WIM5_9HYPH|nr:hypothetical protein [Aureimonas flava]RIY00096.1 hypothetical protein D3218_12435 [Aureimonas flava]